MADYLDHLTAAIIEQYPAGPITLVGFWLRAFVALEVALRIADRDVRLDLVSPATPLGLRDSLPDMAGGKVFALAARRPALYAVLSQLQGWHARLEPGAPFGQILAAAGRTPASAVIRRSG